MKLRITDTGIVTSGNQYSPSIINHDFLVSADIIGKDWDLFEPPISTPFLSSVKYTNGFSFVTELEKIQIVHNEPEDLLNSDLLGVATKYFKKFPQYQHKAVGINVTGFIEMESGAGQLLINKFINPNLIERDTLGSVTVRLFYPQADGRLGLTCDEGGFSPRGETVTYKGILVSANYHTEIPAGIGLNAALEKVITVISGADGCYNHFLNLVGKLFELEA